MTADWRIVDGGTYPEAMHHGLDQAILERVDRGEAPPTLRFWYREGKAVPLGRFQAYADEVAVDYVEDNDIDVVRRITGGGAMYVEPGAVITYSLYLPRESVPADVRESYARLDRWAIEGLNDLGLPVRHEPLNDIAHPEGKIGGAAQLRTGDAVLHHTTMSFDLDTREMVRVLRIGKDKLSDKAVRSAEKRVARIADHVDAPRSAVIDALVETFVARHGGDPGSLTDGELERARTLAAEKFSTDGWNRRL
ncbi:MAG: biotin/lipoate A/B protein ligase family protein [Halobacteriales archaeon]